jgi:hypothetical protein
MDEIERLVDLFLLVLMKDVKDVKENIGDEKFGSGICVLNGLYVENLHKFLRKLGFRFEELKMRIERHGFDNVFDSFVGKEFDGMSKCDVIDVVSKSLGRKYRS